MSAPHPVFLGPQHHVTKELASSADSQANPRPSESESTVKQVSQIRHIQIKV